MSKRLGILEASLKKKREKFDAKLQEHFSTVAMANGQPLNDKRNGAATVAKWDSQNDQLRNIRGEIEKTERAIEAETVKIKGCELVISTLPPAILERLEDGTLVQWRKHPHTFFVADVDKARIVWDAKKGIVAHRYYKSISDETERKRFAKVYNEIHKEVSP